MVVYICQQIPQSFMVSEINSTKGGQQKLPLYRTLLHFFQLPIDVFIAFPQDKECWRRGGDMFFASKTTFNLTCFNNQTIFIQRTFCVLEILHKSFQSIKNKKYVQLNLIRGIL